MISHINACIGHRKFKVSVNSICALVADRSYVTVFYIDGGICKQVDVRESVGSFIGKLPPRFLLTHRATLVDRGRVSEYVYCREKKSAVIKLHGVEDVFRVSRPKQPEVRKALERRGVTIS